MPEPLKALSIRRPWAEQVLRGEKLVEYRSKPTKGGAGDSTSTPALGGVMRPRRRGSRPRSGPPIDELPRGLIVGTVEIVDCTGGDGEYEWQLANPVRLAEPLPPKEQPQPVVPSVRPPMVQWRSTMKSSPPMSRMIPAHALQPPYSPRSSPPVKSRSRRITPNTWRLNSPRSRRRPGRQTRVVPQQRDRRLEPTPNRCGAFRVSVAVVAG